MVGVLPVAGIFGLLLGIFIPNFTEIEINKVNEDKIRVQRALDREFTNLSQLVKDWVVWDDSYKFINDSNLSYIESNVNETTLENNNINAIIYLDNHKKPFIQ